MPLKRFVKEDVPLLIDTLLAEEGKDRAENSTHCIGKTR